MDLGICHLERPSIDIAQRSIVLYAMRSDTQGVAVNTDFVYYIELNGHIEPNMPFSSEEEAYIYVMENGMYYEGEWEIIAWPVD